jgi:type III pantothenate kinase
MLLALDIGNSRIKWGLFDGLRCLAVGNFPTRDFLPLDAQAYEFEPPLPADSGPVGSQGEPVAIPWPSPMQPHWLTAVRAIAVCSVAGNLAEATLLEHFRRMGLTQQPLWRVHACAEALGVRNGYAVPERLGADRWAALVAARALDSAPTVVVMAGTATTVDALDASGRFLGGYILPGLRLMPKSLYERTAGIRPDDGVWSEFPQRTADAVTSGVLAATAGAVAGMVLSLHEAGGGVPVRTLVSGGNGPALLPRMRALKLVPDYRRDLVLEGANRLFLDAQPS